MIQAEQGYYKPGVVSLTARNPNPTYKRMLQHWPKYIRERSYKSVENVLENNPSFQNLDWEIRVLLKATMIGYYSPLHIRGPMPSGASECLSLTLDENQFIRDAELVRDTALLIRENNPERRIPMKLVKNLEAHCLSDLNDGGSLTEPASAYNQQLVALRNDLRNEKLPGWRSNKQKNGFPIMSKPSLNNPIIPSPHACWTTWL
jgi:hypothetical protein